MNPPKRVPRVKIDETELHFFASTPSVHPYWDDLYNPPESKNDRKPRTQKVVEE